MDPQKYKERVEDMFENGFLVTAMGLGYQVGLFEAFRDLPQPCTSDDLADKANLKKRYVKEWLACMVAGKIVTVNDKSEYSLPVDAEWFLNARFNAEVVTMLGPKSPAIVNFMRKDSISGYNYDHLQDVLEWLDKDRKLFMTDQWIEEAITPVTKMLKGDDLSIMDLGCGFGTLSFALAKHFPNYSITGIDESKDAIKICEEKNSYPKLSFCNTPGENLKEEWTSKYDLVIMFDVLHDLANPVTLLEAIKRVLKPDGLLIAFDPPLHSDPSKNTDVFLARTFMTLSLYICLPCSLSKPPGIGHGIGWGYEKRKQFLVDNGFDLVPVGDENLDELNMRLVCRERVLK